LQQWVAAGNEAVKSVFVFNMLRTLPTSERFRIALHYATAVGGLLVATFREPDVTEQFSEAMGTKNSGFTRLDKGTQPPRPPKVRPKLVGGYKAMPPPAYSTFVQIYRRN
jgi:hypothetical protein